MVLHIFFLLINVWLIQECMTSMHNTLHMSIANLSSCGQAVTTQNSNITTYTYSMLFSLLLLICQAPHSGPL